MSTYGDRIVENSTLHSIANSGGTIFEIIPNPANILKIYGVTAAQQQQYYSLIEKWKLVYYNETDRIKVDTVDPHKDYTYTYPVLPLQSWNDVIRSILQLPKEKNKDEEIDVYIRNMAENMYLNVQFLQVPDSSWYKGKIPRHDEHVLVSNNANIGRSNYAHVEPKIATRVSCTEPPTDPEELSKFFEAGDGLKRPDPDKEYPSNNMSSDSERIAYCGQKSRKPDLELDSLARSYYNSSTEQHSSIIDLRDSAGNRLNPVAKEVPSSSLFPTRAFNKTIFGTMSPAARTCTSYFSSIMKNGLA